MKNTIFFYSKIVKMSKKYKKKKIKFKNYWIQLSNQKMV